MSGSMLVGSVASSLVLMAARARILHQQGFAVAGQFDAAWAMSMNHVSLVLASLQTFCLPLLARTSGRAERSAHLTRMLTAAALAAAAVVCVLAWLKPVVLARCIPRCFGEAARYLRWTLIGDYLKVSSWVLSIPMLAAADMRVFLTADLSAYAVFAAGSGGGRATFAERPKDGHRFCADVCVHLAVCGSIAWRATGSARAPGRSLIWTGGLALVLGVSASDLEDPMKVSVAIATFNRAAMVRQAIDAALEQTRPPDEIVVADDASTDATWEALKQLAAGEPRVAHFPAREKFRRRGKLEFRDRADPRRLHRLVLGRRSLHPRPSGSFGRIPGGASGGRPGALRVYRCRRDPG